MAFNPYLRGGAVNNDDAQQWIRQNIRCKLDGMNFFGKSVSLFSSSSLTFIL